MNDAGPVRIDELLAHRAWVRALARSLVLDESRADDLEQETWTRALGGPPADRRSLRAWLARVVRSAWIDSHRAESQRELREAAVARPDVAAPADVVAQLDLHRRVVQLAYELDEPYRTALLLRYFEGLSPRAIAARLAVPEETVRTRLRRALERMRARLDADSAGDRGAWCAALVPLALWTGGAAVKSSKAVTVGVVLTVLAGVTTTAVILSKKAASPNDPSVATAPAPAAAQRARSSEQPAAAAAPTPGEPAAGVLAGDVLAADGRPVARATIRAIKLGFTPDAERSPSSATAGDDGRFAFASLPDGDYTLDASAPGVGAAIVPRVRVAAAAQSRITIRLEPEVAVAGLVVAEEDGTPLAGATLTADAVESVALLYRQLEGGAVPTTSPRTSRTDDGGAFRLAPLLPGACTLTASAPGRIARTVTVRAPAERVAIPLPKGGAVRVAVTVLGDDLPKELLVAVFGVRDEQTYAVTGRETTVVVDGLAPGDREIRVRAAGHGLARFPVRVDAGRETVAPAIVLEAPVELRGVVCEAGTERPIEGAVVELAWVERYGTGSSYVRETTATTDASGAWRERVRAGEWHVAAAKHGYVKRAEDMDEDGVIVRVDAHAPAIALYLRPSPSIVGRVEYLDGSPAEGARVCVVALSQNTGLPESNTVGIWPDPDEVETARDGTFRISGAPVHQKYDLRAEWPAGERATVEDVVFQKDRLETEVRIRLERGAAGRVEGRVVDEAGRPVAGALLSIARRTVATDAEGRFRSDNLAAGSVAIVAGAVGYATRGVPGVEIEAGETTRVPDVVLRRRGISLHGRVTDAAGRPVAGVQIWTNLTLTDETIPLNGSPGGVGPDGAWFIDGPDAEGQPVQVYVSAPGFTHTSKTVDVVSDASLDFVLTRESTVTIPIGFDGAPPATVLVERRAERTWRGLDTKWDRDARTLTARGVEAGSGEFRVVADGYAPGGFQALIVPDGGAVTAKAVRLTAGGTLTGRLVDADGRPLVGVQVSLGDQFLHVDTVEDGRFRLEHVPAGRWTFSINGVPCPDGQPGPEFSASVEEGGTTDVAWRLPR
jgi:RNA polymerase sigma-70 factor (ECF subfamily)